MENQALLTKIATQLENALNQLDKITESLEERKEDINELKVRMRVLEEKEKDRDKSLNTKLVIAGLVIGGLAVVVPLFFQ